MIDEAKEADDKFHPIPVARSGRRVLLSLAACIILAALSLSACSDNDENVGGTNNSGQTSSNTGRSAGAKLAIKAVTSSSGTDAKALPANATDGDATTQWSAGGPPPQWIQLDLGEETTVSKVRLNVSQTPPGLTSHQISGGPTPDQLKLIGTLDGATQDSQWLEFNTPASNIRYLRITTVKSPSWVAWREIEVYK